MQSNIIKLILYLVLILSSATTACKKEKEEVPAFSAVGYWRGNAYNLVHTAVLNRPDGTARIYLRIFGQDTLKATIGNGRYAVNNNVYRAFGITNTDDTLFMDMYNLSVNAMSGALYTTFSGELLDCNLRKQ